MGAKSLRAMAFIGSLSRFAGIIWKAKEGNWKWHKSGFINLNRRISNQQSALDLYREQLVFPKIIYPRLTELRGKFI